MNDLCAYGTGWQLLPAVDPFSCGFAPFKLACLYVLRDQALAVETSNNPEKTAVEKSFIVDSSVM